MSKLRELYNKVAETGVFKFNIEDTILREVSHDVVSFDNHIDMDSPELVELWPEYFKEKQNLYEELVAEFKQVYDAVASIASLYFGDHVEFYGIQFYKPEVLVAKFKIGTDTFIFLEFDDVTLSLKEDW